MKMEFATPPHQRPRRLGMLTIVMSLTLVRIGFHVWRSVMPLRITGLPDTAPTLLWVLWSLLTVTASAWIRGVTLKLGSVTTLVRLPECIRKLEWPNHCTK